MPHLQEMEINMKLFHVIAVSSDILIKVKAVPFTLKGQMGNITNGRKKGSQSSLPLVAKVISRLQPLEQTIRILLQSE